MRVLAISTLFPLLPGDSTGVFVSSQVRALRALDVDVRVVVPVPLAFPGMGRRYRRWMSRPTTTDRDLLVLPTIGIPRDSRVLSPLFGSAGSRQASFAHRRITQWLAGWKPDVLHAHQVLPEGQFATTIGDRLGWNSRTVATIHGADLHATRRGAHTALVNQLASTGTIIVSTPSMKRLVSDLQPEASVAVVPPGLDDSVLTDQPDVPTRWDVVSVGRLVPIKAMQRLFPLAVAGYSVAIAGDGPERHRLETSAPSGVEFLGAVEPVEIARFIRSGRIYAQPSRWDGYGLAAAEAMALSVPVVLSDTVGLSEYITSGVDGYVAPMRDPAPLLDVVRTLLSDEPHAISVGSAGKELIRSHTASKVAKILTDEVYRDA